MPFRHYSKDFAAAELEGLMAVYDECCLALDLPADDHRRAKLAARLVELARDDIKDQVELRQRALEEFRQAEAPAKERT